MLPVGIVSHCCFDSRFCSAVVTHCCIWRAGRARQMLIKYAPDEATAQVSITERDMPGRLAKSKHSFCIAPSGFLEKSSCLGVHELYDLANPHGKPQR